MDSLLDTAPCGFVSFRDDGTIALVNRTLLDMLGYASDTLTGRSFEQILPVGTRIFYQTHFFPLIRMHGHAEEVFLILCGATGENIGVLCNAARHTRGGEAFNDCIMMRVVERQKFEKELLEARRAAESAQAEVELREKELIALNNQLEQQAVEVELSAEELRVMNQDLEERALELEKAREEADAANHAKSTFLAMMSHELRTPLNAISGYAQLLEMGVQGPVTESQKESLVRIQESQRHLLRLVNEILNLARIESGRLEFNIVEASVHAIVDDILPLVEPQAAQKGLSLVVDVPTSLRVSCDVDRTHQILINIVGNAVKFTPSGGTVTITAAESPAAAGTAPSIVLSIEDSGIGIPSSMLDTIFDPFVQVEVSRSRRGEGTGLGLAISRDLAHGMAGELTVASVEGKGSTFYLTLPAA